MNLYPLLGFICGMQPLKVTFEGMVKDIEIDTLE